MTAPASELQKAIFQTLSVDSALVAALGGTRIFDHAPATVAFPYITFGRTSVYDWSTGTESGTEQLFTLHVWSKERGKKEALELIDLACSALAGAEMTLAGHRLVNLRCEFQETRFDEDLSVYHGLVRFRAVTEATG